MSEREKERAVVAWLRKPDPMFLLDGERHAFNLATTPSSAANTRSAGHDGPASPAYRAGTRQEQAQQVPEYSRTGALVIR